MDFKIVFDVEHRSQLVPTTTSTTYKYLNNNNPVKGSNNSHRCNLNLLRHPFLRASSRTTLTIKHLKQYLLVSDRLILHAHYFFPIKRCCRYLKWICGRCGFNYKTFFIVNIFFSYNSSTSLSLWQKPCVCVFFHTKI